MSDLEGYWTQSGYKVFEPGNRSYGWMRSTRTHPLELWR